MDDTGIAHKMAPFFLLINYFHSSKNTTIKVIEIITPVPPCRYKC